MKTSAGILFYKNTSPLEVLLVKNGGPFFKNKDIGWWSIPKGELEGEEDPIYRAFIEVKEETGIDLFKYFEHDENVKKIDIQTLPIKYLGEIKQTSKVVIGYAMQWDEKLMPQNGFESKILNIEWKGRKLIFPEVEGTEWFTQKEAEKRINSKQRELISNLVLQLNSRTAK